MERNEKVVRTLIESKFEREERDGDGDGRQIFLSDDD